MDEFAQFGEVDQESLTFFKLLMVSLQDKKGMTLLSEEVKVANNILDAMGEGYKNLYQMHMAFKYSNTAGAPALNNVLTRLDINRHTDEDMRLSNEEVAALFDWLHFLGKHAIFWSLFDAAINHRGEQ